MSEWEIHGREAGICNCNWGCPCQFGAPSTHGHCQGTLVSTIDSGHFDNTELDGLSFALIFLWPGEIADGNGKCQAVIDSRADDDQAEALRKIIHGESTTPGATHYFIYNSMMSEVFDPVQAPIDATIDVTARDAKITVPGLIEMSGRPIIDAFNGEPARSRIHLPNGFEYTYAEMGTGELRTQGAISLQLDGTYGQFCELHMNQDGVIR